MSPGERPDAPEPPSPDGPRPPRVLVVGCGGIGGNIAGGLLQLGGEVLSEVVVLSSNGAIIEAVQREGFRLVGQGRELRVPAGPMVQAPGDLEGSFDYVILATQPPQVEAAARSVLHVLGEAGQLVVLQNGLCEERLAPVVGEERVIGCIVGWGASLLEPGLYEQTSDGGFTLGRLDGSTDARLQELANLLEIIGPVTVSGNLAGARWSKLAINAAVSTLGTIGGDRLGVLMRARVVRRLALEIMTETVRVARAEGVVLEKVSGTLDLDWLALTEAEQGYVVGSPGLFAKHSLLLAVGTRYRKLRSSMLSAIERGRPPAVDFLNGEIVDRGRRHGIPTPANARARELVHGLARGEVGHGLGTLRAFARDIGLNF